jgi:hypothetical protein
MRAWTTINVVPISITPIQSLLQQNNIKVNYVGTSNFKMELVRFVPLYFMAMLQSIIIITEASFVSTPVTIIGSIKSKPHTPRGIKFVNLHENFPRKVNKVFTRQPSDQRGSGSNPPRPPRYFGLPMVHLGKSPLPLSKLYYQPLNYHEYVKDFDLDAHVRVFKTTMKTNNDINDAKNY